MRDFTSNEETEQTEQTENSEEIQVAFKSQDINVIEEEDPGQDSEWITQKLLTS